MEGISICYNCQYSIVALDAEKILTQYEDEHRFSISNLSHCPQRIYFAPKIKLTEEEKNQAFVVRDGVSIKRDKNVITMRTENLGIAIHSVTTILDDVQDVYVALTGDQCAITNIRVSRGE